MDDNGKKLVRVISITVVIALTLACCILAVSQFVIAPLTLWASVMWFSILQFIQEMAVPEVGSPEGNWNIPEFAIRDIPTLSILAATLLFMILAVFVIWLAMSSRSKFVPIVTTLIMGELYFVMMAVIKIRNPELDLWTFPTWLYFDGVLAALFLVFSLFAGRRRGLRRPVRSTRLV